MIFFSTRRDNSHLYNKFSLAGLHNISGFINWTRYFQKAFSKIHRKIDENQDIIVFSPEYLANVSIMVNDKLKTIKGKNTLNNYMIWQIIRNLGMSLSKEFR